MLVFAIKSPKRMLRGTSWWVMTVLKNWVLSNRIEDRASSHLNVWSLWSILETFLVCRFRPVRSLPICNFWPYSPGWMDSLIDFWFFFASYLVIRVTQNLVYWYLKRELVIFSEVKWKMPSQFIGQNFCNLQVRFNFRNFENAFKVFLNDQVFYC